MDEIAKNCLTYLDKWHDRFWLYGEKPFLQMPSIATAKIQSYGAVLPEISTGNATILTEIQVEQILSDSEKALLLLTLMGFSLGGKKTDNSVVLSKNYSGKSNDNGKASTGKPGPSLGFMGFMHNFLLGDTVLKTIWLNLLSLNQIKKASMYTEGLGIVPWEQMPESENCPIAQSLQKSLMGRLIPLCRFILLTQDGLHYSEGIAHLGYKEGVYDPSVAVNFSGKDPKIIWINPERRPWRYLTALLSFISSTDNVGFECMHIKYGINRIIALQLINDTSIKFGLWSGGLKVSSNAGEQYVSGSDDFVDSCIELNSHFIGEIWFENLKNEILELEKLSKIIYSATLNFFKSQNMDGVEKARMASNLFWQFCERKSQQLIDSCVDVSKLKLMRAKFVQCANKSYDSFCPRDTARQLDAWAKNKPNLYKYVN
jgi:CRISPR system Cascade subunit CasA